MFSQNSEELFILDYFSGNKSGKFIDIGAFHIENLSNTRALYLSGWKGIFVEPQPANYKAIADHYKDDHEIIVLNVAIGEPGGIEIDFYESGGDAVGTTDEGHMRKWADAGVKYTKIKVPQMSVVDFFNEYGKDCDFLSVDTESTNMIIFENIPNWVFEQISLICIEHDGHMEEIEDRLVKLNFTTLHVNAENIILAKA